MRWMGYDQFCPRAKAGAVGDVDEQRARRGEVETVLDRAVAAFREYFKANYGPTIAAYRGIAEDPDRVAALDADIAALADRALRSGSMDWEYLLLTARKR